MLQYQRYIFMHLLAILGAVLLGLTAVMWLMQTLRLVDFIVNEGISISLFLKLSILLLPSMVMFVMPVAMSIAIVFLYHKLRSDSELVVLQSTGLSRAQLATPAIMVALLTVLVAYIISFVILPLSTREFRDMQHYLRNHYISVLLQDGVFSTPVEGLTVYVRERVDDQSFRGVMVHDNRNEDAPVTMMAERADLEQTADGPQFLLHRGNRQELRGDSLSFLEFDSYVLDIGVYTRNKDTRKVDNQERTVTDLIFTPQDEYDSEQDHKRSVADGHQRATWPLLSLCLAIGVLGIMLSGEFNRRHGWRRNMIAAALVVAVIIAMTAIRGLMMRYSWMVPVGYVIPMFAAMLGMVALWPKKMRTSRLLEVGRG